MPPGDLGSHRMSSILSPRDWTTRTVPQIDTTIPLRNRSSPDGESSIDSDRAGIYDNVVPGDAIVFDAPSEGFRLGYIDVACLVLNRMIGSGIFLSPRSVLLGTKSVGASLLFWAAGAIYALAGMHVYLEYGLNVPRVLHRGREQSVARSGADLHYVSMSLTDFCHDLMLIVSTRPASIRVSLDGLPRPNCPAHNARIRYHIHVARQYGGQLRGFCSLCLSSRRISRT